MLVLKFTHKNIIFKLFCTVIITHEGYDVESKAICKRPLCHKNKPLFEGAYVPLTVDGNIIIDGILTSCYASYGHDFAHLGMAPLRWIPEMTGWIFGEDNEEPTYVKIAKELYGWVMLETQK